MSDVMETQVVEYLRAHPDFFNHNRKLLETLQVPHETGGAVSLVERQTSVLREKNQNLTEHLSDLIDIARHNDAQFEKTKRMVLDLLEAETLDEVAVVVDESLCQDFQSDSTSLILFTPKQLDVNNLRIVMREDATAINTLIGSNLPSCGVLTEQEKQFIFGPESLKVQSAAIVPLVKGEALGVLAIGSYDPNYFQSSQGTVLLSYLGEVLSRIVSRILHQPEC